MDGRGDWCEWDWQKNGKVGDDRWKPAVVNFLFLPSRSPPTTKAAAGSGMTTPRYRLPSLIHSFPSVIGMVL